jgi:hypothetical protein
MELKIHLLYLNSHFRTIHTVYEKFYGYILKEHYFYANSLVECEER